MDALNKLKQFDAYPKTLEDFRIKTCGGAAGEWYKSTVICNVREVLSAIHTHRLMGRNTTEQA